MRSYLVDILLLVLPLFGMAWADGVSTQQIGALTLDLSDGAANLSDSLTLGHGLVVTEDAANLTDAHLEAVEYRLALADAFPVPADYATACVYFLGVELECVDSEAGRAFGRSDDLNNWTDEASIVIGFVTRTIDVGDVAATTLAQDDFTDTDNTELSAHGTNWSQPSYDNVAKLRIFSNEVTKDSDSGIASYYHEQSIGPDQFAEARLKKLDVSSNLTAGIYLRLNSTTDNYCLLRHRHISGGRWELQTRVDGVTDTVAIWPEVLSTNDVRIVRFEIQGVRLRGYIDGVLRLGGIADATPASGFTGLQFVGAQSSSVGYSIDNFNAGPLGLSDDFAKDLQVADSSELQVQVSDDLQNYADVLLLQLAHLVSLADAQTLTDEHAQQLEHQTTFTDSLAQLDAAVIVLGYEVPLADNVLALDDSLSLDNGLAVVDALTLTDAYIQALGYELLFTGSLTLTDPHAQVLSHLLSFADDVNAFADTLDLILGHLATFSDDANNLADFSQLQLGHLLSLNDVVVLTDSESQILSYLISFSDDINNFADHIALDLQGVTDERTINVQDSFTLTDEVSLSLRHLLLLDDAIVLSDDSALQQRQLVEFVDTFSLTDVVTLNLHHLLQLSDVIILTDETSVDLSAREQVFTDSLSQQDSITLVLGHWISANDGLQQVDSVVVVATGPERLIGEFDSLNNWADSLVLDVGEIGGFEIVLTDSFVLTDHEFILRGPYTPSQKRKTIVPLRARTTVVPKRKEPTTVG